MLLKKKKKTRIVDNRIQIKLLKRLMRDKFEKITIKKLLLIVNFCSRTCFLIIAVPWIFVILKIVKKTRLMGFIPLKVTENEMRERISKDINKNNWNI